MHALVREDGLAKMEAAELLGRHKSWVCRRLALLEKLGEQAREDLRLGLVSPAGASRTHEVRDGSDVASKSTGPERVRHPRVSM